MSVAKRLEHKRVERIENLRVDIEQRGINAAVDYARNRLDKVPKHGAFDGLREEMLNASLNLGILTETQLEELLKQPQHHHAIREWMAKNLDHSNPVVRVVAAKVLKREIVISSRSGPKLKSDPVFQFAAWQIASDLKELGHAMSQGEPTNYKQFAAAEVIATAVGVSASTARDWIASGQKLAVS
jgi:hypothetical protein